MHECKYQIFLCAIDADYWDNECGCVTLIVCLALHYEYAISRCNTAFSIKLSHILPRWSPKCPDLSMEASGFPPFDMSISYFGQTDLTSYRDGLWRQTSMSCPACKYFMTTFNPLGLITGPCVPTEMVLTETRGKARKHENLIDEFSLITTL